ncbi:sugar ABC transporter substrate-binding protein [Leifsonia sp. NPDC056665]|uniref:sugar ABC transporter substrate-binding protein n=1 Tax=Leifsonia sp. NPDC056665 TaxID=3345901 RepID=UPI0036CA139D
MKLTSRAKKRVLAAVAAAAVAVSLAACSGAGAGASQDHKLKIGVFIPANSNAYLQSEQKAATEVGKELGVDVTVITSNWKAQDQNTAFQLAQQRKTYDGWVVNAISPADQCNGIKRAAQSGIPIIIAITAICGDDGYTKGTVGFVGEQNRSGYDKWFNYMFANTTPGSISLITGPTLDFVTDTTTAAAKAGFASHSNFKLASIENTDYSTDAAYKAAQTFLNANGDLKAIASNYSGMTRGVVQAVKQAGKADSVIVYDSNGDSWTKSQVAAGTIKAALPGMPYTDIKLSLALLVDKLKGKTVATNTNPLDTLTFPGAPLITKDNVDQWKPEY